MKKFLGVCGVLFALFTAQGAAWGGTIQSGTISTANGLVTAGGLWDGVQKDTEKQPDTGFQVVYDVDQTGAVYTYSYTFSGVGGTDLAKALSNAIIEVSSTFTTANILSGTTSGYELGVFDIPQGSTSVIPADRFPGLKWNTSGDPLTFSVLIVTDRAPMLGSFYAKDGNNVPTTDATGTLWVPDTTTGDFGSTPVTPLPAAVWGGIALMSGLGLSRRMHRRRTASL